ncbi:MAG: uroporphyrinogen decarboxylase family protein [Bacteroidales bacterium]|nr:uroporphyrinogen decarboxylase family protein [Bacteroidales bacterium]
MNVNDWKKEILSSPRRMAVPVMTHPGIEMLGHNVKEAVCSGQVHFEAVKALCGKYPQPAAMTTIMDLSVEAQAFGASVSFSYEAIPSIEGRLVEDAAAIEALEVPSLEAGRIPEYLKADKLATTLPKPVFAGCIGPFSLAGRLYGMTEIMMGIYIEPEAMQVLLEKCTEFLLKYVKAIKETGCPAVLMAEPASGLLSNEDNLMWCTPYVKKIIDAVQDDSFAVVLHNCGNTGHCTEAMVATGAWGFHFGNKIDMVQALEGCPADALVFGNVDPVSVFKQANPEEMYKVTFELLQATAKYPNFVLSSGCDTPPGVSPANIEAFYKALEDFNKGK